MEGEKGEGQRRAESEKREREREREREKSLKTHRDTNLLQRFDRSSSTRSLHRFGRLLLDDLGLGHGGFERSSSGEVLDRFGGAGGAE